MTPDTPTHSMNRNDTFKSALPSPDAILAIEWMLREALEFSRSAASSGRLEIARSNSINSKEGAMDEIR